MLGATSFQITLLSGQNWQNNLQLYVLGGVFLVASAVWYSLFRLRPSIYVLAFPWIFYALAFFLIGLPSVSSVFKPSRQIITNVATWCYAVASAAAFLYFGLNFGEEAVRINYDCRWLDADGNLGCSHRGMDLAGLYRAGLAANLGGSIMVLGKLAQWGITQHVASMVDRSHFMASRSHEHGLLLVTAQRSAW
jgi:hypothetical protein